MTRRAGLLLSLLVAGCAAPDGAPAPHVEDAVAPVASRDPIEAMPPDDDRAALLERLARREAELERWRSSAAELRAALEQARQRATAAEEAAAVARTAEARATSDRDRADLRVAAAERARHDALRELAARELAVVQRERAALEAELRALDPDGALADGSP